MLLNPLPLLPPPRQIVPLEHIFALQVNNGPLTAELKVRENNISVYYL